MSADKAPNDDCHSLASSIPSPVDELADLRELLLAQQNKVLEQLQLRLSTIEQRVHDPVSRTSDISEIVAEAISKRISSDDKVGLALKPIVVEQFRNTSREDPELMAEALFPILGPAVRKMIVNIISPDKKSKKISYKLEQIFLIHKSTGLPVCHVSSDSISVQDADVVSGMLNAIQAFVQDAFETDEFDGLDSLQIGELSVWIEWGPDAVLAAVVRGAPPKNLRDALQIKLEQIHGFYSVQLKSYEGNSDPFDPLNTELSQFLDSHDGSLKNRLKNLPIRHKRYISGLGIGILLLVSWFVYDGYDSIRWARLVDNIQNQPGIVVTSQDRGFRQYRLSGLRDPLAVEPRMLVQETTLKQKYVEILLEPYHALHPEFVLKRAIALLEPPRQVSIQLKDSVLYIQNIGVGDWTWAVTAISSAKNIVGIEKTILKTNF